MKSKEKHTGSSFAYEVDEICLCGKCSTDRINRRNRIATQRLAEKRIRI